MSQLPKSPAECLSAELLQEVVLGRTKRDLDLDFRLAQTLSGAIWRTIDGGHKWVHYFDIYDREFSRLRGTRPKVLEIGVYQGASLKLWHKFFGEGTMIVGVDIDPSCAKHTDPDKRIFVETGSQADPEFLARVLATYGKFDLIIDDGSHVVSHQIASFNHLFLDGLKDGGIYWIEDLEGNYWEQGHRDMEPTTVDLFKHLVDLQHAVYRGTDYQNFHLTGPTRRDEFNVPRVATLVDRITFHRGVIVVDKLTQSPPLGVHI